MNWSHLYSVIFSLTKKSKADASSSHLRKLTLFLSPLTYLDRGNHVIWQNLGIKASQSHYYQQRKIPTWHLDDTQESLEPQDLWEQWHPGRIYLGCIGQANNGSWYYWGSREHPSKTPMTECLLTQVNQDTTMLEDPNDYGGMFLISTSLKILAISLWTHLQNFPNLFQINQADL